MKPLRCPTTLAVFDEKAIVTRAKKRFDLEPAPPKILVAAGRRILFETSRTNRVADKDAARFTRPDMAVERAP